MSDTTAKKDIQKLQRAIVDGLEDVKAQDIRVFNTEHLSPLFERVIVASGTSNRQTKALAASVLDKVREAGFAKPRVEGEDNGEWIIVDCGPAVAHVMQPAIRQYYNLEEIWGEKPVRLKSTAAKATASRKKTAPGQDGLAQAATKKVASGQTPAKKAVKTAAKATDKPVAKAPAKKTAARKTAPLKATPPKATAAPLKTVTVNKPVKKAGAKPAAKTAAKTPAKKAATRKPA
ncbi:ribosome silencing factor [Comamonadaceae bacterium OH2545_COT-014]|nr:ribosome silencing factor [Comamonadaceae bacterium OH2545_COT-014]